MAADIDVKLSADTSSFKSNINDAAAVMARAAATMLDAAQRLEKTSNGFDKVSTSAKRASQQIKETTPQIQGASTAILSLNRVLQDAPFGFIGIQNNLTELPNAFRTLSASAKEAGVSVTSVLVKSLMGPAGLGFALSAITSIISFATLGFGAWTRGFSSSKSTIDEAAKALEDYKKALDSAEESERRNSETSIARVNVLTKLIADNSVSYDVRKKAVDELNKSYPEYFKNLTVEKALTLDLTGQVNALTEALLARAAATAAEKKFAEASEQVYETQLKIRKERENLAKAEAQVQANRANAANQRAGASFGQYLDERSVRTAQKNLAALKDSLASFQEDQKQFLKDAQDNAKAAGDLFFKPDTVKRTKDEADRIAEILRNLQIDLNAIKDSSEPLGEQYLAQINKIKDAIVALEKVGVAASDARIETLQREIGRLSGLYITDPGVLNKMFRNAPEMPKFEVPVEIAVPKVQELAPKLTEVLQQARERAQRAALERSPISVYSNQNVKTTVSALNSDEVDKQYKRLEDLSYLVTNTLQPAFDSLFESIIKGSGNAFSAFIKVLEQTLAKLAATIAEAAILAAILGAVGGSIGGATGFKGIFGQLLGPLGGLFGGKHASGGFITNGAQRAIIGESGPEAILPLNRISALFGAGQGLGSNNANQELVTRISGSDLLIMLQRAGKQFNNRY